MINEKENDNVELIKKKVDFYFKQDILVHINLKINKEFLNGSIKEVSADFFMLEERMRGLIPVFFLEVYNIEELKEEKGDGSQRTF